MSMGSSIRRKQLAGVVPASFKLADRENQACRSTIVGLQRRSSLVRWIPCMGQALLEAKATLLQQPVESTCQRRRRSSGHLHTASPSGSACPCLCMRLHCGSCRRDSDPDVPACPMARSQRAAERDRHPSFSALGSSVMASIGRVTVTQRRQRTKLAWP